MKTNGEGLHQLTNTGYDVSQFEWSPDGNQLAVIFNRNGAFDLSLVNIKDGSAVDLRSGTGIHSNPNWSADGSFMTYEYESPLLPPDIYRLELETKQITQLTYSAPPALQQNRKVMPESVCFKSFDGLEIPSFLYKPEKPNGASGMSSPNTLRQKVIFILRQIIADLQAMVSIMSVSTITVGASATPRTASTLPNFCAALLKFVLRVSASQAAATVVI
jgi:dipeptidyl aminopeptidase/acylaminoacyl peptidase